jgi:hypothetical protein
MAGAKVRVRKDLVQKREESSKEEAIQLVLAAIEVGDFDTHLDIIAKAVDDRIRLYQEEDGDGELLTRERAEKMRAMRKPIVNPEIGKQYRVRGEKYAGVVVIVVDNDPEDAGKVVVEFISGHQNAGNGKQYKLPYVALEEIPQMYKTPSNDPVKKYICKKCQQNPVPYNGVGRPPSLCESCQNGTKTVVRHYSSNGN